eukprot:3555463-Heterocapsa_arctica.AAC.1
MRQNQGPHAHQKVPRTGIPAGKHDHPPPQKHSPAPRVDIFGIAELIIGLAGQRMEVPREEDLVRSAGLGGRPGR